MLRYFKARILEDNSTESSENSHETVYNFVHVPQTLEPFIFFGFFICLDSFLYNYTILPIRLLVNSCRRRWKSVQEDAYKISIIVIVCYFLNYIEPSSLYHSIRGQSIVKLYVIFNVLEICDKLCCSFGLDIMNSFFSKSKSANSISPFLHFILVLIYVGIHALVFYYQSITLNVAINSYNSSLMTLLISNQFVEIKSSVFKKFGRDNLFQLACSDIVERFMLIVYLLIIFTRNILEVRNFALEHFIDTSFPIIAVYCSELIVDWLKHSFITKFNHIQPKIFSFYSKILARNASPPRIGFSVFPVSCFVIRQIYSFELVPTWSQCIAIYLFLVLSKIMIGSQLQLFCIKTRSTHDEMDKITRFTLVHSRIP